MRTRQLALPGDLQLKGLDAANRLSGRSFDERGHAAFLSAEWCTAFTDPSDDEAQRELEGVAPPAASHGTTDEATD